MGRRTQRGGVCPCRRSILPDGNRTPAGGAARTAYGGVVGSFQLAAGSEGVGFGTDGDVVVCRRARRADELPGRSTESQIAVADDVYSSGKTKRTVAAALHGQSGAIAECVVAAAADVLAGAVAVGGILAARHFASGLDAQRVVVRAGNFSARARAEGVVGVTVHFNARAVADGDVFRAAGHIDARIVADGDAVGVACRRPVAAACRLPDEDSLRGFFITRRRAHGNLSGRACGGLIADGDGAVARSGAACADGDQVVHRTVGRAAPRPGVVADGDGVAPCGGGVRALRHCRAVGFSADAVCVECGRGSGAPLCACAVAEGNVARSFGIGRRATCQRTRTGGGGIAEGGGGIRRCRGLTADRNRAEAGGVGGVAQGRCAACRGLRAGADGCGRVIAGQCAVAEGDAGFAVGFRRLAARQRVLAEGVGRLADGGGVCAVGFGVRADGHRACARRRAGLCGGDARRQVGCSGGAHGGFFADHNRVRCGGGFAAHGHGVVRLGVGFAADGHRPCARPFGHCADDNGGIAAAYRGVADRNGIVACGVGAASDGDRALPLGLGTRAERSGEHGVCFGGFAVGGGIGALRFRACADGDIGRALRHSFGDGGGGCAGQHAAEAEGGEAFEVFRFAFAFGVRQLGGGHPIVRFRCSR